MPIKTTEGKVETTKVDMQRKSEDMQIYTSIDYEFMVSGLYSEILEHLTCLLTVESTSGR